MLIGMEVILLTDTPRSHKVQAAWEKMMRDIRDDLRERINSLDEERVDLLADIEHLQERIEAICARRGAIQLLLDDENARMRTKNGEVEKTGALKKFLLNLLEDREHWTVDEIKEGIEKQGFEFKSPSIGRSIHFTLVNLKRSGLVESLSDGSWVIKGEEPYLEDDIPF